METISVTLDRVLDDTESSRLAGTQDLDVSWTRVQFAPDGEQKRILVTDHTSWELTGGVGEFKTEPTPPGNALHVVVRGISEEIELWVTVAEGDSGKDLSELQTVDPGSLEPSPQAASAWELEATARAAADDDLATELAAKADATALTAEAAARAADVASLQSAIDELPTDSDVAAITQSTLDAIVAGAPAALDTLVEIADRIADGDDTVAALTATVGTKASQSDLDDEVTARQGAVTALTGELATKADRLGIAAALPLRAYGHSGLVDVSATQLFGYFNRARKRLGSIIWNNLAVGGMLASDIAGYAYGTTTQTRQGTAETSAGATSGVGTWTPSALPGGIVVVDAIGNDAFRDSGTGSTGGTPAKSRAGAANALEALVRLIRAASVRQENDGSLAYGGTWTNQNAAGLSGGSGRYTLAPGATLTFTARNGDTIVLLGWDASAAGFAGAAWSLTADGQPYKTGTTNNQTRKTPNGGGSSHYPIHIDGLTDGDHTFVLTHTGSSGQFLYLDCILRESPTPPTVILVKTAGIKPEGYAQFTGAGPETDAIYDAIIDTLAAKFPADDSVIVLDPKDYGFDPDLHIGADFFHANDAGAQLLAEDMLVPAINALEPRPGLTR